MSGANWASIIIALLSLTAPAYFIYRTAISKDKVAAQTNIQTGQFGAVGQAFDVQNTVIENLQTENERVNKELKETRLELKETREKVVKIEKRCDRLEREIQALKGGSLDG